MKTASSVSSLGRVYAIALVLGLASLGASVSAARAQESQTSVPLWDYQHGINPATNVKTTGPYDWEDLYRGPNGFPLPGDSQIR
jgi:hypothetical protein